MSHSDLPSNLASDPVRVLRTADTPTNDPTDSTRGSDITTDTDTGALTRRELLARAKERLA